MSARKPKVTVLNIQRQSPTIRVELVPTLGSTEGEYVRLSIDGEWVCDWNPDPEMLSFDGYPEDLAPAVERQIFAAAAKLWVEAFAK